MIPSRTTPYSHSVTFIITCPFFIPTSCPPLALPFTLSLFASLNNHSYLSLRKLIIPPIAFSSIHVSWSITIRHFDFHIRIFSKIILRISNFGDIFILTAQIFSENYSRNFELLRLFSKIVLKVSNFSDIFVRITQSIFKNFTEHFEFISLFCDCSEFF